MRSYITIVLLSSAVAHADVAHHGFTAAVDVGGGSTLITANDPMNGAMEAGPGASITVGGFVRPDLAIAYHHVFLSSPFDSRLTQTGVAFVAGCVAQWWPNAHVALTGGLGFGVAQYKVKDPMSIDQLWQNPYLGIAPIVGASVLPFSAGLRISVEAAPTLSTSGVDIIAFSLSAGWQYLR